MKIAGMTKPGLRDLWPVQGADTETDNAVYAFCMVLYTLISTMSL